MKMPYCVSYYGKKKCRHDYDTVYDAQDKARTELKYNGADKVEVYGWDGSILERGWKC